MGAPHNCPNSDDPLIPGLLFIRHHGDLPENDDERHDIHKVKGSFLGFPRLFGTDVTNVVPNLEGSEHHHPAIDKDGKPHPYKIHVE